MSSAATQVSPISLNWSFCVLHDDTNGIELLLSTLGKKIPGQLLLHMYILRLNSDF